MNPCKRVRFSSCLDTSGIVVERRVRRKMETSEPGSNTPAPSMDPVSTTQEGQSTPRKRKSACNPLADLLKSCTSDPAADVYMPNAFSAQLADTYIVCCCEEDPGENDGTSSQKFSFEEGPLYQRCVEQLSFSAAAMVATNRKESSRGLERLFIPLLTSQRRKRTVASVLLAQTVSRDAEILRTISESNTRPAKKFARAIAAADAMSALVAYQGSSSSNNNIIINNNTIPGQHDFYSRTTPEGPSNTVNTVPSAFATAGAR